MGAISIGNRTTSSTIRVQLEYSCNFENFQNHSYLLFTNCTRSCDFFIYSTFNKITSFPWKLTRYSYGVQFGINCTALDQSKLSNFAECTINEISVMCTKWKAKLSATFIKD